MLCSSGRCVRDGARAAAGVAGSAPRGSADDAERCDLPAPRRRNGRAARLDARRPPRGSPTAVQGRRHRSRQQHPGDATAPHPKPVTIEPAPQLVFESVEPSTELIEEPADGITVGEIRPLGERDLGDSGGVWPCRRQRRPGGLAHREEPAARASVPRRKRRLRLLIRSSSRRSPAPWRPDRSLV